MRPSFRARWRVRADAFLGGALRRDSFVGASGAPLSPRRPSTLGSRGSTSPNQTESSSDASGKLFIGGVSWQTTEEGLAAYFKQFGELIDVALMKNKHTGQPRGFGFVKYRDSSVVDLVLAQDHLLDGRTVDVKRAVPREAPLRSAGRGNK